MKKQKIKKQKTKKGNNAESGKKCAPQNKSYGKKSHTPEFDGILLSWKRKLANFWPILRKSGECICLSSPCNPIEKWCASARLSHFSSLLVV
jgi:hypothetical protein